MLDGGHGPPERQTDQNVVHRQKLNGMTFLMVTWYQSASSSFLMNRFEGLVSSLVFLAIMLTTLSSLSSSRKNVSPIMASTIRVLMSHVSVSSFERHTTMQRTGRLDFDRKVQRFIGALHLLVERPRVGVLRL